MHTRMLDQAALARPNQEQSHEDNVNRAKLPTFKGLKQLFRKTRPPFYYALLAAGL